MKSVREGEQAAVRFVIDAGAVYGFGNLIAHLQTAWAKSLIVRGMDEESARCNAGGDGYPFGMQNDIVDRGEWDETGNSYRQADTPNEVER